MQPRVPLSLTSLSSLKLSLILLTRCITLPLNVLIKQPQLYSPFLVHLLSVQSSVDNWTMTKWRQIHVDQMDAEMRRFAKVRSPAQRYITLVYLSCHLVLMHHRCWEQKPL